MTNKVLTEQTAEGVLAGFKLRKPSDIEWAKTAGACMVLYGQGGAGKTLLAAMVRELGRTLHIDAEGGTDVLDGIIDENYDIIDIYSYREFKKLVGALKRNPQDYRNIIVDNLCELADLDINEIAGEGNAPQIQHWGEMTRDILHEVRDLRNLARRYGINVIFIAWDSDEKDGSIIKKNLALNPALQAKVPGIINIVGHVRVLTNPHRRMLDFAATPKSVSKFRRANNASAMEVPLQITYGVDNLPLADVLNTIQGRSKWDSKKYSESRVTDGKESK